VKKMIALLLALLMCVSLVACGEPEPNPEIVEFVEATKDELLVEVEAAVDEENGWTFASNIEVIGDGIEITIKINELDNVEKDLKVQLQEAYDELAELFEMFLDELQVELPVLEYITIYICECDGDQIAVIEADGK